MRIKAIRVSSGLWQASCMTGWEIGGRKCLEGLPEGAVFVGAFYKQWDGRRATPDLIFTFMHPSFEDIPEGEPIPEIAIVWERTE